MRPAAPREDRPMHGLAIMCAAALMFTSIDTSAKWLILSGLPILQVVFVRYAGHFVASLFLFLPREGLGAFRSNAPGLQFLRATLLLASTAFNFAALKFLPITVTTAIYFASPIVITLLSVLFLGERIGGRRFAAILVGFGGVMVVVQPWGAAFHWAMWLSLGALLCASSYFVLTRRLAGVEANSTSQLWASGLATLVMLPIGLPVWVWPDTVAGWGVLAGIGVFAAFGHSFATTAHRFADASSLAPMVYIQVIYATASGYLIFGNLPTGATVAGTAVIIGSGVYIWWRERALMLERRQVAVGL
ncbi:MAG: DMT family transporter [Paracoccaceae bacterium]|nr:DMT family transporter [Paracoccaceae bacterium]